MGFTSGGSQTDHSNVYVVARRLPGVPRGDDVLDCQHRR